MLDKTILNNLITMRTKEEIENAIKVLEQNKIDGVPRSIFGEDNIAKTNARIDVIKNQRSEDWVYRNYPSVDEDDEEDMELHGLWRAVMSALDWLDGREDLGDMLFPVKKQP